MHHTLTPLKQPMRPEPLRIRQCLMPFPVSLHWLNFRFHCCRAGTSAVSVGSSASAVTASASAASVGSSVSAAATCTSATSVGTTASTSAASVGSSVSAVAAASSLAQLAQPWLPRVFGEKYKKRCTERRKEREMTKDPVSAAISEDLHESQGKHQALLLWLQHHHPQSCTTLLVTCVVADS